MLSFNCIIFLIYLDYLAFFGWSASLVHSSFTLVKDPVRAAVHFLATRVHRGTALGDH